MDLLLAFFVFTAAIAGCISAGIPLCVALFFGLTAFFCVGIHRGFSARALCKMIYRSRRTTLIVCQVLFFIGCLTALWRASGTIAFFVYYGIQLITPHWFLLIAFLLSAGLSYALGSSFGTVGTVGVMLITLARSGNVDLWITAGAILSGAYVGERCAPTSSAALLISAVTGVEHNQFLKRAFREGIMPFILTAGIFAVLSWQYPIHNIDADVLVALKNGFYMGWPVVLPALLLLLLPWFHVRIVYVIMASGGVAFLLAVGMQQQTVLTALQACVLGYEATVPALKTIFSGGGIVSMLNVMGIILLSNGCVSIFQGTDMLVPIQSYLTPMIERWGFFPSVVMLSFFLSGVFCNQSIGITLSTQLTADIYTTHNLTREDLAADLSNSIVTIAGLVPWSVACAVPLSVLHIDSGAVLYSVWLYLVPLYQLFVQVCLKNTGKKFGGCK